MTSPIRTFALAGIIVLSAAAFMTLAWFASATLLLILAGILFGIFLYAMNRLLGKVLPLGHSIRPSAFHSPTPCWNRRCHA